MGRQELDLQALLGQAFANLGAQFFVIIDHKYDFFHSQPPFA